MEYRTLGRTGMQVSTLCLGAMMLGAWGNDDQDDAVRIVHRALDSGINFIDTADVYSAGGSEQIIGRALSGGRRDDVILATKGHHPMGPDPNHRGNSRRWLIRAVEASLRRLNTDWIDLYYVHRHDPTCDLDETLAALTTLVDAGTIRAFGCSSFPAHEIVEAHWVAERRGRERFACEQPEYSILVRHVEADVLPVCRRQGMGVVSWSPLAAGWLTGRYRRGADVPAPKRAMLKPARFDLSLPHNQRKLDAVEALSAVAADAGIPLIHMALAFVLQHPAITCPIIGPRTMEQLESQLGAVDVVLGDDVLDRIDEIVPPGTSINTGEFDWRPPAITLKSERRRPPWREQRTAWTPPPTTDTDEGDVHADQA
jgi:aryl-alcohol dehydrogenase-like predicted oxidoreductase